MTPATFAALARATGRHFGTLASTSWRNGRQVQEVTLDDGRLIRLEGIAMDPSLAAGSRLELVRESCRGAYVWRASREPVPELAREPLR